MESAIAYIFIILLSAISWHYSVKGFGKAVVGSTLTVTVFFQLLVIFTAGYFDPFFTPALIFIAILTAIITSITGIPFILWRKHNNH